MYDSKEEGEKPFKEISFILFKAAGVFFRRTVASKLSKLDSDL